MEIKNLIDRLDDWDGVDAIYNREFDDVNYHGVFRLLEEAAAALEQLQAENDRLHDELEKVDAERDAVIKELNGVSSLVDDLAEFVDREIHPVVDYNLYLDLRENVDAVSMFQHEDEWRGLHKEE